MWTAIHKMRGDKILIVSVDKYRNICISKEGTKYGLHELENIKRVKEK